MLLELKAQFLAMGWIDWTIFATAMIYIVLATKQSIWCWFFGIISCSLWGYMSYQGGLYADALLQVCYVLISFWGIYQWQFGKAERKDLPIRQLPNFRHFQIFVVGSLLAIVFGYLLKNYTEAAATYLDSWTTIFALIATFMVTYKVLENWLYWLVIDAIYIYLYLSRDLLMLAIIMVIYIGIATYGYFEWKKQIKYGQKKS